MAAIDPQLMAAAGFTGASAQQSVENAQAKAAINTNQLALGGEQKRRQIEGQAEASGMLRSTMTAKDLGYQQAGQGLDQQSIDLGVQSAIAGANIDVAQELARQKLAEMEAQQQRDLFNQQMALQWAEFDKSTGAPINRAAVDEKTGGRTSSMWPSGAENWSSGNG